jgi:hypothetical protein
MAFGEQRHRQKSLGSSDSKSNADFNIPVSAKASFQDCTSVLEAGSVRKGARSSNLVWLAVSFDAAELCVLPPARELAAD